MSNSQARVEEIYAEAARLFASKNVNYGDSWREQGWRGNVSRILEKAKRIRNMVWRQSVLLNGSSEHPRETLMDMMNTCAFAIINMDDNVEWGHEDHALPVPQPHHAVEFAMRSNSMPVWTPERAEASGELPPEGRVVGYNSAGDEISAHPVPANYSPPPEVQRAIENTHETIITPHVGNVPPPGEEPAGKPSPRRRSVPVTDRGSGPRKVKDNPQA